MNDTTTLLRLIDNKSNVHIELGTYVGLSFPRVLVDVGGGRIPAEVATEYRPEINEQVQVLFIDGKPYMLGPAIPKPAEGTVLSSGTNVLNIQTDIGTVTAPYPFGMTGLTAGVTVKLMWSSGPFVIARMSTSPPPAVAPPTPGGGGGPRQQVFTATQAGSWQTNGSRWIANPRASNGYLGAWHYGTKIRDTIPGNATNPVIEVYINYTQRSGNPPNFALHNHASQGGSPALFSSTAWDPAEGWQRLPSSIEGAWFDSLKGGGNALGIGLDHGGQNIFASLSEDPSSGALRISWTA